MEHEKAIKKRLEYISILLGLDPLILLQINNFIKNHNDDFTIFFKDNKKHLQKENPGLTKNELIHIAYCNYKLDSNST